MQQQPSTKPLFIWIAWLGSEASQKAPGFESRTPGSMANTLGIKNGETRTATHRPQVKDAEERTIAASTVHNNRIQSGVQKKNN